MAELRPLLQIIHVTDLHLKAGRSDLSKLASGEVRGRAWLRKIIEKLDIGGWHDGTLGHDDTGAKAFYSRMQEMIAKEPVWFGAGGEEAETWLVDSGDASVNGDVQSLSDAHSLIDDWQATIPGCRVLSLFGNHDAWPGTHPASIASKNYPAEIGRQKAELARWTRWDSRDWVQKPLQTTPSSPIPRIECYGLNSVSDGHLANIFATGEISAGDIAELKLQIDSRQSSAPCFRILLTHHPLSFPYKLLERRAYGLTPQMTLKSSAEIVKQLRNDEGGSGTCCPYIHLFLSGHTHMASPGEELPENIKDFRQKGLGRTQAQLVGGSLMQLHSREVNPALYEPQARDNGDFSDASVFSDPQQFQVLRFLYDSEMPQGLWLDRWVFARTANKKRGYVPMIELCSRTFMLNGDQS